MFFELVFDFFGIQKVIEVIQIKDSKYNNIIINIIFQNLKLKYNKNYILPKF